MNCTAAGGVCSKIYPLNEIVQLTATPGLNNASVSWGWECGTNGLVTMDTDKNCTVTFVPNLDGCFTDSNASNINLTNYPSGPTNTFGLINRVQENNLGYMLTDPTRNIQTQTFRTKLAGNINKYITSRYCPTTTLGNWNAHYINDSAFVDPIMSDCSDPLKLINRNKSGYFYYTGTTSEKLLTVKNTSTGPVTINKPTVLYVTGADVYIKQDIRYLTTL